MTLHMTFNIFLKIFSVILILLLNIEEASLYDTKILDENTLIYTFNEEFEHLQDTWRRYNNTKYK